MDLEVTVIVVEDFSVVSNHSSNESQAPSAALAQEISWMSFYASWVVKVHASVYHLRLVMANRVKKLVSRDGIWRSPSVRLPSSKVAAVASSWMQSALHSRCLKLELEVECLQLCCPTERSSNPRQR